MEKCVHLVEYGVDVYEDGRVWVYPYVSRDNRSIPGRFAKHTKHSPDGYIVVTLPKVKSTKLHRLLAIAFLSKGVNHTQVNHLNGVKSDNRLINLEWCTPAENIKHAVDTGLNTNKVGLTRERNLMSKLTTKQVEEIRTLLSKKELTQREIGCLYNVSHDTISKIKLKKRWGDTKNV